MDPVDGEYFFVNEAPDHVVLVVGILPHQHLHGDAPRLDRLVLHLSSCFIELASRLLSSSVEDVLEAVRILFD